MEATDRRRRASEEATEWLMLLQGDVTHARREQFIDWLRESPLHVAEMLRMSQVHGALEQFNRWSQLPTDGSSDTDDTVVALPIANSSPPPRVSHSPPNRGLRWALPLAAIVVAAVVALVTLSPLWRGQVIQTDRAERREVALADGSVVQVDPETRLRIKYEDGARYILLEHGRALFHVAKNKDRPFLVQTVQATVRAVGTTFAVEQQLNSVLVTVAEGKVEVSAAPSGPMASEPQRAATDHFRVTPDKNKSLLAPVIPSQQIFLVANQQVAVDGSGSAEPVRTINSSRALAWAEGRLVFEYTSIGDAVDQFNKYNSIQLIVNDRTLAGKPINGIFNASDPESFVAFIQTVTSVKINRTGASDISIDPIK